MLCGAGNPCSYMWFRAEHFGVAAVGAEIVRLVAESAAPITSPRNSKKDLQILEGWFFLGEGGLGFFGIMNTFVSRFSH